VRLLQIATFSKLMLESYVTAVEKEGPLRNSHMYAHQERIFENFNKNKSQKQIRDKA